MSTLKIGIMSFEDMQAYTIGIAKGRRKPKRDEPKVWFTSVESVARVLSERNRELLSLIAAEKPGSLQELEDISGRTVASLSRTLKTMEQYGIVALKKGKQGRIKPRVKYSGFSLDMPLALMDEHNRRTSSKV